VISERENKESNFYTVVLLNIKTRTDDYIEYHVEQRELINV